MSTKPRAVNWQDTESLQCGMLASWGMSTKKIMEDTGLTACQVSYRLKLAGIKRADYRNGTSAMSRLVIERMMPRSNKGIRDVLGLKVREMKGKQ